LGGAGHGKADSTPPEPERAGRRGRPTTTSFCRRSTGHLHPSRSQ
jgi:hypothetical protein